MRLQGESFKTEGEVGAANRLLNDEQIYVTANSLNKTLKDAIEDGDISGGSASLTIVTTSSPNTKSVTENNGTVFLHTASPGTTYQLPAASASAPKRFTFVHLPSKTSNNLTVVVTTSVNDKIDYFANSGVRVATLAAGIYVHGNSGTSGTLGDAIKTAMDAASGDGGTYTVTFDRATRRYTITRNSATFYFLWSTGSNIATHARKLMGWTGVDGSAAISQVSDAPLFDELRIQPASGDRIWFGEKTVDNPGWLAIRKYGGSVTLVTESDDGWVVDKWTGQQHEKNYTIGQEPDVGVVGRNTWTTLSAGIPEARAHHAGENLNGYGYIHLGAVGSNNYRSNSHQYNDSLNAWFITASAQSARWDGFCYTFNGFTYHVGNAFPHLTSHDRYNDATNTWTTRQPFNASGAVSAGPGLGLNGYGIIFNNVVGGGGSYTSRYNDATNAWNSLALRTQNDVSIPFRNGGPSAFNGYAYRVAGFLDPGNFNTISTSEQYNDSGNFWIQKAKSSIASGAGTYMNLNGNLILVHGITNPGSILRSSVEQYNDSLNTFTSLTPAANSKAFRGGFSSSGYGYVAGGEDGLNTFTAITSAAYQYN